jgi:hypothetical protein
MAFNAVATQAQMTMSADPPPYCNVEDFMARGSAKEKAIIKIVQHHSKPENSQGNALLFRRNGDVEVDPRPPVMPIYANPRPAQFVIYCEFVQLVPWLVTVSLTNTMMENV